MYQMVIERTNQLKVMLSDEEVLMLKELAESEGASVSDQVRRLVRAAHKHFEAETRRALVDAGETPRDANVRANAMRALGFNHPVTRDALKRATSRKRKK